MPSPEDSLFEQRRALPDSPGVYLFKDERGRALYVGKAKSIRKRVASHFSGRTAFWPAELVPLIDSIASTISYAPRVTGFVKWLATRLRIDLALPT